MSLSLFCRLSWASHGTSTRLFYEKVFNFILISVLFRSRSFLSFVHYHFIVFVLRQQKNISRVKSETGFCIWVICDLKERVERSGNNQRHMSVYFKTSFVVQSNTHKRVAKVCRCLRLCNFFPSSCYPEFIILLLDCSCCFSAEVLQSLWLCMFFNFFFLLRCCFVQQKFRFVFFFHPSSLMILFSRCLSGGQSSIYCLRLSDERIDKIFLSWIKSELKISNVFYLARPSARLPEYLYFASSHMGRIRGKVNKTLSFSLLQKKTAAGKLIHSERKECSRTTTMRKIWKGVEISL